MRRSRTRRRLDACPGGPGKPTGEVKLESAVGVAERRQILAHYATWTAEDLEEFNEALATQRILDDPLWR
jgi:hypothetical protein